MKTKIPYTKLALMARRQAYAQAVEEHDKIVKFIETLNNIAKEAGISAYDLRHEVFSVMGAFETDEDLEEASEVEETTEEEEKE